MLKSLNVTNYKSLASFALDFGKFNAIVGANNSGKSNILDCLSFLSETCKMNISQVYRKLGGFDRILYAGERSRGRYGAHINIEVNVSIDTKSKRAKRSQPNEYSYGIAVDARGIFRENLQLVSPMQRTLIAGSEGQGKYYDDSESREKQFAYNIDSSALLNLRDLKRQKTITEFRNELSRWRFFNFSPSASRIAVPPVKTYEIGEQGESVGGVLHTILSEDYDQFSEVQEALRSAIPEIEKLKSPLTKDGKTHVGIKEKQFLYDFDHRQISDGTIKLLANILTAYIPTEEAPSLACFEEPENFIHPRLIETVADLLHNAPFQVITTTHSPTFVNYVGLDELVIIEKKEGNTIVLDMPKGKMKKWLDKFSLGELWYSGKIGGVP